MKNDALRIFQGGVWTLAAKKFVHSSEIYRTLIERRDLDAYYFLLRIRCWMHLRRPCCGQSGPGGSHPQDVLGFDDFASFGEMPGADAGEEERFEFANDLRARLLSARRRVVGFARGIIERELREGRRVAPDSPIIYGAGGLHHSTSQLCRTNHARSRAALSLLLASQHYGVPVDMSELQGTFHNAGDWLERVPEVAALFYETRGSLADSFAFLSQIDGAEERLFPGRARFEASLDVRVLSERRELRGALELRKLRTLEDYIAKGMSAANRPGYPGNQLDAQADTISPVTAAALLDADHLAAVKLALKTKRLPVTAEDETARKNEALSLHERFASGFSGVPVAEYYRRFGSGSGFTPETLEAAEFLVANRRVFKFQAIEGQNDRHHVALFRDLCGTEQRLHALYVFTCADRSEWGSEPVQPARWFSIRELYLKTLRSFHAAPSDPSLSLLHAGYAPEEQRIIRDFGDDFFSGLYQRHANRFGSHLVRLALNDCAGPKAAILREGASLILGVAARDFPGLASCIGGSLWKLGIGLRQAHCFCATTHHLALDFFHLDPAGNALPKDLAASVEEAVRGQLHLGAPDESALPRLDGGVDLQELRTGEFRLRYHEDRSRPGTIYTLCLRLFRHLQADIHGLSADVTRSGSFITIHHSLPSVISLAQARRVIHEKF